MVHIYENKYPEYIEYEDLDFLLENCPSLKAATALSEMDAHRIAQAA